MLQHYMTVLPDVTSVVEGKEGWGDVHGRKRREEGGEEWGEARKLPSLTKNN